jgi:hypothetical protein
MKEEEIKVVLLHESILLSSQRYIREFVFFMDVPIVKKLF